MTSWSKIKKMPFFIRLTHFEFWPMNLTYIPVFFYYIFLAIRARSFFFFTAANPEIETGGMLGETKMDIQEKIPAQFRPKEFLTKAGKSWKETEKDLKFYDFSFPLIAKPNIGERGLKVAKLFSLEELEKFLIKNPFDFIIQEFLDHPLEFAVMFYYIPGENKGYVNSICQKEFLTVLGDGESTIDKLLQNNFRAILQLERLRKEKTDLLKLIPALGEKCLVEPIGNHSKGTKFVNANHLINESVEKNFYRIMAPMKGVYLCRFDLKCRTIDDLATGNDLKIMEVNGVGAEPAHIYDPNISFLEFYKALFKMWHTIFMVGKANHKAGIPYMTLKEMRAYVKEKSVYYSSIKSS